MVTAVDTNILSSLLSGAEADAKRAQAALTEAAKGELLICPIVYAELRAAPRALKMR